MDVYVLVEGYPLPQRSSQLCLFSFMHRLPHPLLLTSLGRNRAAVIVRRELSVVYQSLHNRIRTSLVAFPASSWL